MPFELLAGEVDAGAATRVASRRSPEREADKNVDGGKGMNAPTSITLTITPVRVTDLLAGGERMRVRALDPELVWLAHEHEPWRPPAV